MADQHIETGRIIAAVLKLKNRKAAFSKAADDIVDEFDAKIDRLSAELLSRLNEQKMKSFRSDDGICTKQLDITPTGSDWDAFYAWVAETNSFEALERRIKKTFIADYMKENKGAIPPGVSVLKRYKVAVKKNPSARGLPPDED